METTLRNYTKLKNNLETLKLTEMKIHIDEYIDMANSQPNMSLIDVLLKMTDIEVKRKEENAVYGCVKTAGFPYYKEISDFDFDFQPTLNKQEIVGFSTLKFLENNENI